MLKKYLVLSLPLIFTFLIAVLLASAALKPPEFLKRKGNVQSVGVIEAYRPDVTAWENAPLFSSSRKKMPIERVKKRSVVKKPIVTRSLVLPRLIGTIKSEERVYSALLETKKLRRLVIEKDMFDGWRVGRILKDRVYVTGAGEGAEPVLIRLFPVK